MKQKETDPKKRRLKIIRNSALILVGILAVLAIAFGIYVSDYYKAEPFDVVATGVSKEEHDDFYVYGDTQAENGLIFYPGGKVATDAYEPLMTELASQGICCVLVKMPFHLAVFDSNAADNVLEQVTSVDHWYIGGHSLGGAMAAVYAASHTDQLSGLVLMAAYPTKELPEDFPVLSLYGTEDGVLNQMKYQKNIGLAKNLTEIVIQGGNHGQFGNYGAQSKDKTAQITPFQQWEQVTNAVIRMIQENN